mmetsp:Transcript_15444/g.46599  ORF Transcript_15444/g.46599 Transcript_15444/m.46599 type:complete len:141 (+) Transcript_15444:151-573(+)
MGASTADTISQLQECNAELCAMFFNYAGALQRDAPPQAVNDFPVQLKSSSGAHTVASIPELAAQIVQSCKQFDELAQSLPEKLPMREEQLQTILSLQEQVLEGRKVLAAELALTQQQLRAVQDMYGALADAKLQQMPTDC